MTKKSIYIYSLVVLFLLGCAISKKQDQTENDNTPRMPFRNPRMKSINYPKNDGLIYCVYLGHSFSGYELANGWLPDTINGLVNELSPSKYSNPYLKLRNSYRRSESIRKDFEWKTDHFLYYRYDEGKLFNGYVIDTVVTEIGNVIFEGFSKDGLLQGPSKFYFKNDSILCQGMIKDGEIIDQWEYYTYISKDSVLVEKRFYRKGLGYPEKIIEYKTSVDKIKTGVNK